MFGSGIATVLDRADIRFDRGERRRMFRLEIPDKSWRAALRYIENVVQNQYLAVDIGAGADADHRHC